MQHHTTTSRSEAERLLGIAEKLLRNKDLSGCRDFAILAQETEPLLEGTDQILAVSEVLLAADKKINNKQNDWYSILKIPSQRTNDFELIKKQYRQLALLLHPDKNRLPLADSAFRFVADAWAVLSDPARKTLYDSELSRFTKVDLVGSRKQQSQKQKKSRREDDSHQKLPVRRSGKGGGRGRGSGGTNQGNKKKNSGANVSGANVSPNFWTPCPYCYNLYEYSRAYEGCCVRCDNGNCRRTFTAVEVSSMPPMVPGQDAYYCCWGFFPMGFVAGNVDGFQKWMPPPPPNFHDGEANTINVEDAGVPVAAPPAPAPAPAPVQPPPPPPQNANTPVAAAGSAPASVTEKRKRGRPRKNV